jgi:hypothetical protein
VLLSFMCFLKVFTENLVDIMTLINDFFLQRVKYAKNLNCRLFFFFLVIHVVITVLRISMFIGN